MTSAIIESFERAFELQIGNQTATRIEQEMNDNDRGEKGRKRL